MVVDLRKKCSDARNKYEKRREQFYRTGTQADLKAMMAAFWAWSALAGAVRRLENYENNE
jgi:hypothetical protein